MGRGCRQRFLPHLDVLRKELRAQHAKGAGPASMLRFATERLEALSPSNQLCNPHRLDSIEVGGAVYHRIASQPCLPGLIGNTIHSASTRQF